MKLLSWLLLAMVLTFVGMTFVDRCDQAESADCPPTCHLSCVDGCAAAPVEPPSPQLAALALAPGHGSDRDPMPLRLTFPPDYSPPRA